MLYFIIIVVPNLQDNVLYALYMHYGRTYKDASYMPSFLGISLFLNTQKQKVEKNKIKASSGCYLLNMCWCSWRTTVICGT